MVQVVEVERDALVTRQVGVLADGGCHVKPHHIAEMRQLVVGRQEVLQPLVLRADLRGEQAFRDAVEGDGVLLGVSPGQLDELTLAELTPRPRHQHPAVLLTHCTMGQNVP